MKNIRNERQIKLPDILMRSWAILIICYNQSVPKRNLQRKRSATMVTAISFFL